MQPTAGRSSGATGEVEWRMNADDGLKTRVLVALERDAERGAGGIWELGEALRHGLSRVLFDTQSYSRAQGFQSLLLLLADTSVFMTGCGAAAISALFLRKVILEICERVCVRERVCLSLFQSERARERESARARARARASESERARERCEHLVVTL